MASPVVMRGPEMPGILRVEEEHVARERERARWGAGYRA